MVHQDDIGVKMDAELKKNIAAAVKPSELHKFSTKHPNACCSFVPSFVRPNTSRCPIFTKFET